MPWTATDTIPAMQNKSLALRQLFAETANLQLSKNRATQDAVFAGLAAVANEEKKQIKLHKESAEQKEQKQLPAHLRLVIESKKALDSNVTPNSLSDKQKTLISASWDSSGRLVLLFDDNSKLVTEPVPSEYIQNSIVQINPMFDYVQMNTSANMTSDERLPGMLTWNQQEDCLDIVQQDGSTLQTGLEQFIQVKNNSGVFLPNGSVVMFSGVDLDETPECIPMTAAPSIDPLYIIGVLTNDLPVGTIGRATVFGKVRSINTTGSSVGETWNQGDLLWVHPTQVGRLTNVKPTAPNPAISVAAVLKQGITGTLLVRPTVFPRLFYGTFRSLVTQTPTVIDTPYAVAFEDAQFSSGVSISNSSRITCQHQGLYSFDFRLQVTSTNSSSKNIYVWARINGSDVPDSATKVTLSGNAVEMVLSWSFTYKLNQQDYFQLMYACDDASISITAPASTSFCPATPSAVIKVNQIDS